MKRNHYDVLDIPYDATDEEIKNAFVKKSQQVSFRFSLSVLQTVVDNGLQVVCGCLSFLSSVLEILISF